MCLSSRALIGHRARCPCKSFWARENAAVVLIVLTKGAARSVASRETFQSATRQKLQQSNQHNAQSDVAAGIPKEDTVSAQQMIVEKLSDIAGG